MKYHETLKLSALHAACCGGQGNMNARHDDTCSGCSQCGDIGDCQRCGVSGNICDCGVGITPQMCNTVSQLLIFEIWVFFPELILVWREYFSKSYQDWHCSSNNIFTEYNSFCYNKLKILDFITFSLVFELQPIQDHIYQLFKMIGLLN